MALRVLSRIRLSEAERTGFLATQDYRDWETIEELEIDPCDMDELISFKLGIDFNKLQDEGDSFEIESIDKKGDKYFLNLQDAETVEVTYQELYDLYEKGQKRHAEWRKKFALGK